MIYYKKQDTDMTISVEETITPLILTYNEAPNIGRTLTTLKWAKRVVVLDSGSTDDTESIARSFPNVDWQFRPFDSFKEQTDFGIHQTNIKTDYVLALDADMRLGVGVVEEMHERFLPGKYDGGLFTFKYCVSGVPLAGSIYPAQVRLFRRSLIQVQQVGHGHKFNLTGSIYRFKTLLFHDDRKSIERWTTSQLLYSLQELNRILSSPSFNIRDRLRQNGVMPWIVGIYSYLRAGGPFRGAAASRYAYERMMYECLLAIRVTTERLKNDPD